MNNHPDSPQRTPSAPPACSAEGPVSPLGRIAYPDLDYTLPLPVCHRPGCSRQWRDEGYQAAYPTTYEGDDLHCLDGGP